jgi:hypothetical protein
MKPRFHLGPIKYFSQTHFCHVTLTIFFQMVPAATSSMLDYQSCVICMEELPPEQVRQHNACSCVMCTPCLDRTLEHHESDVEIPKGQIKCPGCRENADPAVEFVTIDQIGKSKPKLRMFTIPVLMRHVSDDSTVQMFGYPFIINLPNQVSGEKLYEIIDPLVKVKSNFDLVLVDSQGKGCSRCLFSDRCQGCHTIPRSSTETVLLQSSDNIAISYSGPQVDFVSLDRTYLPTNHPSMSRERVRTKLNLEECLEAFSEEETLDDNNPWYCPMCQKNQCATKTLSVWKFPDFLMIYLKRYL